MKVESLPAVSGSSVQQIELGGGLEIRHACFHEVLLLTIRHKYRFFEDISVSLPFLFLTLFLYHSLMSVEIYNLKTIAPYGL